MFTHILIPTDGSPASARAVKAGIAFAKEHGASVTAYHAVEPIRVGYGDGYVPNGRILAEIERRNREAAKKNIAAVARAGRAAGVSVSPLVQTSAVPYQGIVDAAARRKCDLIFMGTHGYTGLTRLALGSVAEKVTRLAKVPVLVYR